MATDTKAILLVLLSTLGTSSGSAMLKLGSASASLAHPLKWVGIAAIIAGMSLIGRSSRESSAVIVP